MGNKSSQELANINFMDTEDDKLDSVVRNVVGKYRHRALFGKAKYGTDLDRNDLNLDQWMQHLQEELMDATLYLEKLRQELKK
jgi:hypothetical protein